MSTVSDRPAIGRSPNRDFTPEKTNDVLVNIARSVGAGWERSSSQRSGRLLPLPCCLASRGRRGGKASRKRSSQSLSKAGSRPGSSHRFPGWRRFCVPRSRGKYYTPHFTFGTAAPHGDMRRQLTPFVILPLRLCLPRLFA